MRPTVIIDCGHGKDTPGKRSDLYQFYEWEFTRRCGNILKELLIKAGFSYFMIESDLDTPLKDRIESYNNIKDSIILSLHGNAFTDGSSANGFEYFTSPGQTESDKIGEVIYKYLSKSVKMSLRTDKSDGDPDKEESFYILVKSKAPAILFELGFYTNENDVKLMKDENWIKLQMESIVKGLIEYYG